MISKLLGISAAFLGLASGAEPIQLATMVCGSCHTLEIVKKRQTAKDLTESVCTLCHEFTRVQRQKLSNTEWAGEIRGMLAEGAPLTDEEFEMVVNYLAKTYGVKEDR